ncbi:MAG: ATP-dependent DNA helicase RecG, partial [Maritimibacter sp.]|nr:ATP-dependent DNA helicase RecG [Maritimibacter sp.]
MATRPEILFPLFAGLETLGGVGPKTAKAFEALDIELPRDLLFALPYAGIDRRFRASVQEVVPPATVTVEVEVGQHRAPRSRNAPHRVDVRDTLTTFQLVFFHANLDWLQRQLPTGQRRLVSGKVELFDNIAQMVHPDYILRPGQAEMIPDFEPVYHLAAGVTQKTMLRAIGEVLTRVVPLPEWIDAALIEREHWPAWHEAVRSVHAPEGQDDIAPQAPARRRLAYDEFFAHQLTLALARATMRRGKGRASRGDGHLRARVLAALPYRPTGAQARAMEEIAEDL